MKNRLPALFLALGFVPAIAAVPELCGECRLEKFAACGGFLEVQPSTAAAACGRWTCSPARC